MANDVVIVDGSVDFSGGVDSNKVATIVSNMNPQGLSRNQLAWLINGTTRGGGILQRTGWQRLSTVLAGPALFGGGYIYEPRDADPYLIVVVVGQVYLIYPNTPNAPVNLSQQFGKSLPPTSNLCYFCQAEEFLVIQAGDYKTLPLFWDGTTLTQSKGITNPAATTASGPHVNEIPPAGPMDYYMGRLWYAAGRNYSAGDIVGGQTGTLAHHFRDSVLCVQENPLCTGGDGFTVPTNAGNIRALRHSANLDTALGQGQLFIFTRKQVYSLTVPITRTDWIAATSNNQPLQKVVQITNGAVNDRSLVSENGDLFYQSFEPGVRSLITAIRYFDQWGNTPISVEEDRILQYNDRSLMDYASGISFSNRLLQCVLPKQTPSGVVHQVILPLNFDELSTVQSRKPPIWEGMYEGLDVLQLYTGDFGGRERAFAMAVSRETGSLDLWELTDFAKFENGDNRVTWQIEFPAFTWGDEFALKRLVSGEVWLDKIWGEVVFTMEYWPDGDPCWHPWVSWKECTQRGTADSPVPAYPPVEYRESYRSMRSLPKPPDDCDSRSNRPASLGYQFQPRLTIKGWCRIRGILLYANKVERSLYKDLVC